MNVCDCLLGLTWEKFYRFSCLQVGKKVPFKVRAIWKTLSHYLEMPINHLPSCSGLSQKLIIHHFITSCLLQGITTAPWADGGARGAEHVTYRLN